MWAQKQSISFIHVPAVFLSPLESLGNYLCWSSSVDYILFRASVFTMSTVNVSTSPPVLSNPRGAVVIEGATISMGFVVIFVCLRIWGRYRYNNSPGSSTPSFGEPRYWMMVSDLAIVASSVSILNRTLHHDSNTPSRYLPSFWPWLLVLVRISLVYFMENAEKLIRRGVGTWPSLEIFE